MMKMLKRIDTILSRVEGWLVVVFLTTVISATSLLLILRFLYTHFHTGWASMLLAQLDWTDALARLLVLWLSFLGASLLTGDQKHIRIDLMSAMLPRPLFPYLDLALSSASLSVCTLMIKTSIQYVGMEKAFAGHLFLEFPAWIGQLILPVGFSLLSFRFLLKICEILSPLFGGQRI
jgi:TRAP-type C4-dicarboxylate transport system permease small subunit